MPVAVGKSVTDHKCVDYPITFYVASSAHNSGSLNLPRIIAASNVHFGMGHPLNRTEILYPHSDGYMPEDTSSQPRMSIITRRALLRGLLQALVSVKDIYRVGRASTCLHICTSSRYLDLVWNEWLPDWDQNGWPNRQDEEEELLTRSPSKAKDNATIRSSTISFKQSSLSDRRTRRMSTTTSAPSLAESAFSAMTGDGQLIYDDDSNRLVNEDLLRKVAIYRRNFFSNARSNDKGAAYIRLIRYQQNPADKLAKEAVKAAALDLTTQLPRRPRSTSIVSNGSTVFSSSADSRRKSQASLLSQPLSPAGGARNGFGSHSTSPTSPTSPLRKANAIPAPAPANMPVVSKRPSHRKRMLSKDVISEHGGETDVEEFNDAATTLSEDEEADTREQSTLAKVVSLPAAIVGAGVAAVMAPSEEKEPVPAVTSGEGSFEKETMKALEAVKTPSPDTESKKGVRSAEKQQQETIAAVPKRISSTNAKPVAAAEEKAGAGVRREPPAETKPQSKPGKEQETTKESLAPPPAAPIAVPTEEPVAKHRSSFLSLRRRFKDKGNSSASPVPSKPATDRLIDYRPPQGRNLRGNPLSEEANEKTISPMASTFDKVPSKSMAQTPSRRFSLFRKRTNVREVF